MFCKSCGTQNDDDMRFCSACGSELNTADVSSPLAASGVTSSVGNVGGVVTRVVSTAVTALKGKPRLKILLACLAGLIVIAIVAGIAVSGVKNNPLNALALSLSDTVDKGNFDFKITFREGNSSYSIKGSVKANLAKEEIMFDLTTGSDRYVLYKGEFMAISNDRLYDSDNIEDELDEIFKVYKEQGNKLKSIDKLDIKELLEEYGEMAGIDIDYFEEYIDFKKFNIALKNMVKRLNDEKYLEDKFGFSKEKGDEGGTKYSFSVSEKTIMTEIYDCFESALLDVDDFDIDDYGTKKAQFSFTVDGNYLTQAEVKYKDYQDEDIKMTLTISNIGKASIDEKELKEFYDDI